MNRLSLSCFLLILMTAAWPWVTPAQADPASPARLAAQAHSLSTAGYPHLTSYLAHLRSRADRLAASPDDADEEARLTLQRELARLEQIQRDMTADTARSWQDAPIVHYGVPAISSIQRLPDATPADGHIGLLENRIAAQGEHTPLSLVVIPLTDINQFHIEVGDLSTSDGRAIPSSQIDVKVVKNWYQAGTAWHSYFADVSHRKLIPELLLNDDTLIRVDHTTRDNYLRVDDPVSPRYEWISAPAEIATGAFDHHREPVADSPTFKPLSLHAGQARQFWLTLKVPLDAQAGHYQGTIHLTAEGKPVGQMTIHLRVLPFTLPEPRTYYDLDRRFHSFIYNSANLETHLELNGGNWELAEKKLTAELTNMVEHGAYHYLLRSPRQWDDEDAPAVLTRTLEIARDAGIQPPLFNVYRGSISFFTPKQVNPVGFERSVQDAQAVMAIVKKVMGHSEIYAFGFDEPSMRILLAQHDGWRALHQAGFKIYSTSKDSHYPAVGYAEDFANYSGWPRRDAAARWHAVGHRITNYAGPHTGPENPEFIRRTHGMLPYKAWYDGTGNYKYYDQHNIWNDFASTRFRGFNMVYPTKTGVIDTLAWEGYREGITDVRYATKLKTLATQAAASTDVDVMYAGKKALLWLELFDEKHADLRTMRLEMIRSILDLRQRLGRSN